jgi:hypothetical protein
MNSKIQAIIDCIDLTTINDVRAKELLELTKFIQDKKDSNQEVLLNFICTHNSRRSQFSQLWAQVAANYYGITATCFSGGVEVTAFNERAVESVRRFGFEVTASGEDNPQYQVAWGESVSMVMFSKLYDDKVNPKASFAAVMTCAHADENCPLVTGCELRIPIRYEDPKRFDDTPLEETMYDARSFEIATELFFVFSKVK